MTEIRKGQFRTLIFLLGAFLFNHALFGQGTGLVFDDEAIHAIPKTAQLATRDFTALPRKVDLSKYAPNVGNQGQTGTCTAWSSVYHARTISFAFRNGMTDKAAITRAAFSPSYVYNQIRYNNTCSSGTRVNEALEVLKTKGTPTLSEFAFDCDKIPNESDHANADDHKILDYKILCYQEDQNKVELVKKSLANNNPVIFGMYTVPSFSSGAYYSDVWNRTPEDKDYERGGHAMVIVGYDDDKYGGAFRILNSWGAGWGDSGYLWIKYDDAQYAILFAAEMIDYPGESFSLGGSITFNFDQEDDFPLDFDVTDQVYRTQKGYLSGTQFQFTVNNQEAAYMYVIGSDNSGEIFQIFPFEEGISPYLGYQNSNLIFPDEDHFVELDNQKGEDTFCVLYSSRPINLKGLLSNLSNSSGELRDRVYKILGERLLDPSSIDYDKSEANFSAESNKSDAIVPLFVKIKHI
ncbi:MAG: C1 family peptidase [Cytophagales bacterium]|nr:C1 family peptidase [Cytophagales bacterium]